MLRGVADLTTLSLAEDRRLMEIVFELEEVTGGIFEKERVVLDVGTGEPDAGLLIEGQSFRLGLLHVRLRHIRSQIPLRAAAKRLAHAEHVLRRVVVPRLAERHAP